LSKQTFEIDEDQLEKLHVRAAAWYSPVERKVYQGKLGQRQAQIVGVPGVSAVDVVILLQEVLGLERPAYNLRNTTRVIVMDNLKASIPVFGKHAAFRKVPELTETGIAGGKWSTVDFSLWKNKYPIVVSDEAQMRAGVDIFGTQTRDAAGALAEAENLDIKDAYDTATTATGHDWGDDDNNPYDDIIGVMTTIGGKGYPPDFIAAQPLVWGKFFGNKYVKGQLAGAVYPDLTKTGGFPVPGLAGVTGFSDFALNDKNAVVGGRNYATVLGSGPTSAVKYRDEDVDADIYMVRQWLEPKVVISDALRQLTGVRT
jgi:hypothetical protein